jgi:acyl-coenzyme A thioesterase PaaI-like protein
VAVLTKERIDDILAEHFAPWMLALGIEVETVATDVTMLRVPFTPALCEKAGTLSRQALLAGADAAMVIALSSAAEGSRPTSVIDLSINYTGPIARGDALLEARVLRLGRAIAFCTATIRHAGSDELAAVVTGTYSLSSA